MLRWVAVALVLTVLPTVVLSQTAGEQRAVLRGSVLSDSTDAPIPDAEVSIESIRLTTRALADGTFRLGDIPAGTYLVWVRSIGYVPMSVRLRFAAADSMERDFLLVRSPVTIAAVDVKAKSDSFVSPKMRVFESRMRAGTGHFLTGPMLDSMKHRRLGEILMSRAPGASVVSRSSFAWVGTRRGHQSLRSGQTLDRADIVRGADPRMCYAAIHLDGVIVYGGRPGEPLFDVNSLQTSEIAGIEYYAGAAQVPAEINATLNTCGVLVIWTK